MGIVTELVFADLSDREVTGLRMGKHQARDAGVGFHGATLGETDADLFHVYEIVEDKVKAGVWQRGITYGRTDALKLLHEHIRDGEVFILRITPVFLSDLFVHTFCSRLSQTVCEELRHHFLIGVGGEIGFEAEGDGSGEKTYFRGRRKEEGGRRYVLRMKSDSFFKRRNEIGET